MQAICILQAIVLIIIFDIMASVGWRNPSESLRGISLVPFKLTHFQMMGCSDRAG